MSGDQIIMSIIGLILVYLTGLIFWDLITRDSFTYDEKEKNETD